MSLNSGNLDFWQSLTVCLAAWISALVVTNSFKVSYIGNEGTCPSAHGILSELKALFQRNANSFYSREQGRYTCILKNNNNIVSSFNRDVPCQVEDWQSRFQTPFFSAHFPC